MSDITRFADYSYRVKELQPINDEPVWCIECDAHTTELPFPNKNVALYMELKQPMSKSEAEDLAGLLNTHVKRFIYHGW